MEKIKLSEKGLPDRHGYGLGELGISPSFSLMITYRSVKFAVK